MFDISRAGAIVVSRGGGGIERGARGGFRSNGHVLTEGKSGDLIRISK